MIRSKILAQIRQLPVMDRVWHLIALEPRPFRMGPGHLWPPNEDGYTIYEAKDLKPKGEGRI